MTTKEQERKALEKIKKIIEGLGENSYVGTAFDGCFELANSNIEYDAAFSMKGLLDTSEANVESLKKTVAETEKKLKEANQKVERLTKELEKELDWQDYELEENVKQVDYDKLATASGTRILTDDEAKDLLYDWFGFAKEKTTIHHKVPTYQKDRHGRLRSIGTVERRPAYNATDWNYIRFDCGMMSYELYNDSLGFFVH